MEYLSPPTDNLYKFKALSGVSIILMSMFLPFQSLSLLQSKSDDVEIKAAVLHAEIEWMNKDAKKVEQRLDDLQKESKSEKTKTASKVIPIDPVEAKRVLNWTESQLDRLGQIEVKRAELAAILKIIKETSHRLMFFAVLMFISSVYGLWLASNGFKDWKEKVQIYMDKELQMRTSAKKFDTK